MDDDFWTAMMFTAGSVILGNAIFHMLDVDVVSDYANEKIKSWMGE
jgi:hypothetical protein